MTGETLWWCDLGAGPLAGPYTAEQLRALVADGAISARTRIWSSAGVGWRSAREFDPRPPPPSSRTSVLLGFVTAAYWLLLAFVVLQLFSPVSSNIPARSLALIWPCAGVLLAAASVGGSVLWWMAAPRLCHSPARSGALKAGAVGLAMLGTTTAYANLSTAEFRVTSALALEQMVYGVHLDRSDHRLSVTGEIGPGFAERVARELHSLGAGATLEISSSGGLVDEAVAAARAIEAKGDVTVIARGACVSACMVVLMAGDRRLADQDAILSLHAVAPVGGTRSQYAMWLAKTAGVEADHYLRGRGVPEALIARANALGPDRLERIEPAHARRLGILHGFAEPLAPDSGRKPAGP